MNARISTDFKVAFEELSGNTVTQAACIASGDFQQFELKIGGQRLCWEVKEGDGRCFLMKEDAVDGAGVFPLAMPGE